MLGVSGSFPQYAAKDGVAVGCDPRSTQVPLCLPSLLHVLSLSVPGWQNWNKGRLGGTTAPCVSHGSPLGWSERYIHRPRRMAVRQCISSAFLTPSSCCGPSLHTQVWGSCEPAAASWRLDLVAPTPLEPPSDQPLRSWLPEGSLPLFQSRPCQFDERLVSLDGFCSTLRRLTPVILWRARPLPLPLW